MDLVIHTTTWWGNHPSMVYYSGAQTHFEYTIDAFKNDLKSAPRKTCFTTEKNDWVLAEKLSILSENKTFILGVK